MEMTQSAFAKHVGVGIASLQRWEKGVVVQDEASDRLLRDSTRHTTFVFEDVAGLKNRSEWQESIRIEGKILKRTFEELLSAKKSRTTGSPSTEPDRFILNDSTLATAA
jgi:transcriptional regulator with XRE-family HTH domain